MAGDRRQLSAEVEAKVFRWMDQHHMVTPGDRIILGVSGGADSMCLLTLFLRLKKQIPLTLHVVHVDHQMRQEAKWEAAYVEEFCRKCEISFHLFQEDVAALSKKWKCSTEDAGRRLRYQVFRETLREVGADKIAVAHNASDRAETMLLHLFRGSGLTGLCGIEPVRGDLIRPLLCLERKEIEGYLQEEGIVWCNDVTNEGDAYTRNRIRHHILSFAEEQICSGAVRHMCRTADLLSETESYLRQQTQQVINACVQDGKITAEEFLRYPAVLQKRAILECLEKLSPTGKDISMQHVEDVLELFSRPGNRVLHLPFGIRAIRSYETVELAAEEPESVCELPEIVFRKFSAREGQEIPRTTYTKWFDYDTIGGTPVVRFRQTGDFLFVTAGDGSLRHKSLKEYMITEKIPRQYRDRIPLLAVGNHVLWVIGYRTSDSCRVTARTGCILEVSLPEGTIPAAEANREQKEETDKG